MVTNSGRRPRIRVKWGSVICGEDRVRRKPEPLFSRLDDELLGLDTHAGLAYSLNRSAGRVWELIGTWMTVGAVCDQLEQEYEVEHQTCLTEVVELLGRLRNAGLVEVEGGMPR